MPTDFWNDRRVFVTGHTGFKGAWLALWLERLGADVTGYSLAPPTDPNLFDVADVARGMTSVIGDIRELETLSRVMADAEPEVVIHMAAQSLVHHGYEQPLETYSTNVMGTANVLEATRRVASVGVVISVTTDKCYDNKEWHWGYRESDPLGGKDPYSSSKACAEIVTAAYRASFLARRPGHPVAVATARAGNVIGGGDWAASRLLPDLIRGFCSGQPVLIRRPDAIRPWQHVLEPLSGYLQLAERLWTADDGFASAWNFGPSDEDARTVRWVADRSVELWGEDAGWEQDTEQHPPEATFLRLDCSHARAALGWTPRLDLERALEWTVEWYRAHRDGKDVRAQTIDQIARFEKLRSRS